MRIGFTGTRRGMTDAQRETFRALLSKFGATWLHHGDCVGADADAHDIAVEMRLRTVIHPPVDEALRAFKLGDQVREAKTHFARNRDIAQDTGAMLATPAEAVPQARGGTWYTINYGRLIGKPVTVILPDGRAVDSTELR